MFSVTSQNIAGHIIGVTLTYGAPGAITPTVSVPGAPHWIDGSCDAGAIVYSFSPPFIAGDQPPASPPATVVDTPSFPVGAALTADVLGRWRIGTVATLPGPDATT
ncbi:MAG: hypothetical protein JOZ75_04525, partial [Candidatus Dormibacteraeota bacterium]|nr:hypothetical protein [Candidatus Dormibacteraeota bacterium]